MSDKERYQTEKGPIKKVDKGEVGRNIKDIDRTFSRNEMQEVRNIQNSRSQKVFEKNKFHSNYQSASYRFSD